MKRCFWCLFYNWRVAVFPVLLLPLFTAGRSSYLYYIWALICLYKRLQYRHGRQFLLPLVTRFSFEMATCLSFEQMLLQASVLLSTGPIRMGTLICRGGSPKRESDGCRIGAQGEHGQRLLRLLRHVFGEREEDL